MCKYLIGRRCLLKDWFAGKPFATSRFCRENCHPDNPERQIRMLLTEYDIHVETLPPVEFLHGEYEKQNPKIYSTTCPSCGQIKNIVKGFGRLVWERISKGKPDESTVKRSEICSACEYRTFLNVIEWGVGFVQDKDLPINHSPNEWDALWCSKCKCCIESKIRVPDEKCPEGKW